MKTIVLLLLGLFTYTSGFQTMTGAPVHQPMISHSRPVSSNTVMFFGAKPAGKQAAKKAAKKAAGGNSKDDAFAAQQAMLAARKKAAGGGGIPTEMSVEYRGKVVKAKPGSNLGAAAAKAGMKIKYNCKKGDCGTCAVRANGATVKACSYKIPKPGKLKSLQTIKLS